MKNEDDNRAMIISLRHWILDLVIAKTAGLLQLTYLDLFCLFIRVLGRVDDLYLETQRADSSGFEEASDDVIGSFSF